MILFSYNAQIIINNNMQFVIILSLIPMLNNNESFRKHTNPIDTNVELSLEYVECDARWKSDLIYTPTRHVISTFWYNGDNDPLLKAHICLYNKCDNVQKPIQDARDAYIRCVNPPYDCNNIDHYQWRAMHANFLYHISTML